MSRIGLFSRLRLQVFRFVGSQSSPQISEGEQKLSSILKKSFPKASEITVSDISGGCGAMYEITIDSIEFKDKSRVQQHRMVNAALKDEIKDMHGLRILTTVPMVQ